MRWWSNEMIWSTWIVGGRYITCLARFRSFTEVYNEVQDHINQVGLLIPNHPIVLVNQNSVHQDDWDTLVNGPEGSVTIVLE